MGMGETLIWAGLAVAGGYVFIYHVLPAMGQNFQQALGEFLPPTTGGTFLPPTAAAVPGAAAATGQTKCWEVGDGSRACSCQGKQHTIMGKTRPCEDCYQYCGGGGLPDRSRVTNNPTPQKVINPSPSGCTVQQFTTNCLRNTACQYCWYSTGKSACTNVQGCSAARATWLARHSSGPTNVPPTRPTTGPASGTQESFRCTITSTGTVGRRWICRGAKTGRMVTQGPDWRCLGLHAQVGAVGATCTVLG